MKAFANNLRALIEREGLTQQKFADSIGVSITTVNGWIKRNVHPKAYSIDTICSIYGLSSDDLLSYASGLWAQTHGGVPANAALPKAPRRAYAPLLGRVHAGDADEPEILEEEVPIPYEVWEHHKSGYFLMVEGSCMNKVYPEGSRVFVDPTQMPQDGSIAVVSIDGAEYVMRRLKMGVSALMLCPESFDEGWDDIVPRDDQEVRMVGTVVWYQSAEELD